MILFYHALEHLVILMFLESLYQEEFEILTYSWTVFSNDLILVKSVVLIFSRALISLETNISSF